MHYTFYAGSCAREPVRRRPAPSLLAEVLRVAGNHLRVGVAHGETATTAAESGGVQLAARREADAAGAAGGQLWHEVQQSEGERRAQEEGKEGGHRLARDGAVAAAGKYLIPLISLLECKQI